MQTDHPDDTWPKRVVDPHRDRLVERAQLLTERIDQARGRYAELGTQADTEVEGLSAKISDLADQATDVEYLTWRAAVVDRDLVEATHGVSLAEQWLALEKFYVDRNELYLRIGQLDHLVEGGSIAAGNDDHLALLMLDVKESSLEQITAAASLDFARQRLTLTKRMHRDVHTALRKLQRSTPGRGTRSVTK